MFTCETVKLHAAVSYLLAALNVLDQPSSFQESLRLSPNSR